MLIKSEEFLEKRLKLHYCHGTYRTNFFNKFGFKNFLVSEGIFRPECSPATLLMCEYLMKNKKTYAGKEVCDLGCGSGIFSIITAMNGASKVIAIDINNKAVKNTKENAKYYNLKNISVKKSNLFQNIDEELFDIILTNFPTFLEDNIRDYNLFMNKWTLSLFFKKCRRHLKKDRRILLSCVHFNDMETIDYKEEALKNRFNFRIICDQNISIDKQTGKVILYEFFI